MVREGPYRLMLTLSVVFTSFTKCSQAYHADLRRGVHEWITRRDNHSGLGLTDVELRTLVNMDDHRHFHLMLDPILVPRVPGTPGNTAVRKHIADSLRALQWSVEEDQFLDNTPLRRDVSFTNIVATLDPHAPRRLVLACHYDSLLTNSGRFVGATDSAVPCAQLINLAHVLDTELKAHRDQGNEVTLQLVFFDGEEAFVRWSRSDSTYGARNLAAKLDLSPYTDTGAQGVTHLHRMDLFVLLDLMGARNPKFYSYFPESEPWYVRMMSFERRLEAMDLTRGLPNMLQQRQRYNAGIEDDHIPFLERDVPILHLIPSPFPRGWHKDSDNKASLHSGTIANQNALLRAMVADYLHLQL